VIFQQYSTVSSIKHLLFFQTFVNTSAVFISNNSKNVTD